MGCIDACNGVFAVRNGEYDRGIAFYRQAETDDPADRNLWEQGIAWAESARKQAIVNVHPNVNVQPTPNADANTAAVQTREKKAEMDALWERGKQLQKNKDYKGAEAIWRQVIALDPDESEAFENLGYVLSMQDRDAEAVEVFRKTIQMDPKNTFATIRLGISLEVLKRYAEAEQVYRQGMKIEPGDSYTRSCEIRLGYALAHQNRFAEAEDLYRKALAVTPGDTSLQHALESVLDLETKARQQKPASQPATPLITAGENLRDAPNSGGSGTGDTANSSPSQKALDEASSSLGATGQGLQSTTPEGKTTGKREDAVAGGSKIFDTKGPKIEAPPVDLRGVGKAPAVAKLLSHIPKNPVTTNDKEINASITWYSELESNRAEKQQQIADIQKQIDSKQGDQATLEIRKNQFKTDIQNLRQDQQNAEDAIKKRLVKLDMPWIENPAPPKTDTKPDTATQEKQP
jgi:tetratricopeptide (TPR) repeat protein